MLKLKTNKQYTCRIISQIELYCIFILKTQSIFQYGCFIVAKPQLGISVLLLYAPESLMTLTTAFKTGLPMCSFCININAYMHADLHVCIYVHTVLYLHILYCYVSAACSSSMMAQTVPCERRCSHFLSARISLEICISIMILLPITSMVYAGEQ